MSGLEEPKSGEQGPEWGGGSTSFFAVKRRHGHRDCRQKPDAFSPSDHLRVFRSGLLKAILRVIIRLGILLVWQITWSIGPDFKLLNCKYDIVTSTKRKQLSFVAGCIETDSAELSTQISGEADWSQMAGRKRWTTA
jgi:hypothetical protein